MILALVLALATLERYEAVEPHMGTLARILVFSQNEAKAHVAMRAAFARIREIDERLSDYKPESELNRVSPARRKASDDLWRVLEFSQRLAEATGGAFDVTLGNRTRAWREGKTPEGPFGWRHLHRDSATREVWLDNAEVRLDLGAIAKGYAAQEAFAILEKHGLPSALVALSGDIVAGDAPPNEPGWKIGIPQRDSLVIKRQAVSSSGDTEQHKPDGSHIHDGATGKPLTTVQTVTVIAADGMTADALATAVRVLGSERGEAVAKQFGARVY